MGLLSMFSDPAVRACVDRLELPFDRRGIDPYGIAKADLVRMATPLAWMYRTYFSVRVAGLEHVPARGRAMLVGNHSGGVALDAAMVLASMLLDKQPPRLAQGMAEKFINRVPFASMWSSRTGQFTGIPEHAERLLEDERLLLVFPEGARGTAKLYWERHSLVEFGTGFVRLALQTRSPIVPFAFAGGGEAIPTVRNLYALGRLFGMPYLPVTPYLLLLPRRVPLAICYGEPMRLSGTGREDDEVIEAQVDQVKQRIAALLEQARRLRTRE